MPFFQPPRAEHCDGPQPLLRVRQPGEAQEEERIPKLWGGLPQVLRRREAALVPRLRQGRDRHQLLGKTGETINRLFGQLDKYTSVPSVPIDISYFKLRYIHNRYNLFSYFKPLLNIKFLKLCTFFKCLLQKFLGGDRLHRQQRRSQRQVLAALQEPERIQPVHNGHTRRGRDHSGGEIELLLLITLLRTCRWPYARFQHYFVLDFFPHNQAFLCSEFVQVFCHIRFQTFSRKKIGKIKLFSAVGLRH